MSEAVAQDSATARYQKLTQEALGRWRESLDLFLNQGYSMERWVQDATYFGVELPLSWLSAFPSAGKARATGVPVLLFRIQSGASEASEDSLQVTAPDKGEPSATALGQLGGSGSVPKERVTARLAPGRTELHVSLQGLDSSLARGSYVGLVSIGSSVLAQIMLVVE